MRTLKTLIILTVLAGLVLFGLKLYDRLGKEGESPGRRDRAARVIPVEVDMVGRGRIDDVRGFTGTVEPGQEFVVSPKVSGRIEQIDVDLADTVSRGQIVARLDNDEYVQARAQAEADLAVAQANLNEAEAQHKIAQRELTRIDTLRERGVSTEAQMDEARANQLARSAALEVAKAQVTRANAALETSRIRLAYSNVTASWQGGSDTRVVAERFVDEGETVNDSDPLLRIVELDRVVAVLFITERDYGLLQQDQVVALATDAYPGEQFEGRVARIAPVFREATRQARVELLVENPTQRLKPGMFIRASVILRSVEDAVIVPESALVKRDGETGVFMLSADGNTVRWQVVTPDIRQDNAVQITGVDLQGEVVTLGQQLLDDGSAVSVQRDKLQ